MRKWDLRKTLLFYEDMSISSHRVRPVRLISHIVRGKRLTRTYLLILSSHSADLMEIVESGHSLGWYPLTEQRARVIGIAEGREEALRMMEEILLKTVGKGRDLKEYYRDKVFLTSKEYKRRLRHGGTC